MNGSKTGKSSPTSGSSDNPLWDSSYANYILRQRLKGARLKFKKKKLLGALYFIKRGVNRTSNRTSDVATSTADAVKGQIHLAIEAILAKCLGFNRFEEALQVFKEIAPEAAEAVAGICSDICGEVVASCAMLPGIGTGKSAVSATVNTAKSGNDVITLLRDSWNKHQVDGGGETLDAVVKALHLSYQRKLRKDVAKAASSTFTFTCRAATDISDVVALVGAAPTYGGSSIAIPIVEALVCGGAALQETFVKVCIRFMELGEDIKEYRRANELLADNDNLDFGILESSRIVALYYFLECDTGELMPDALNGSVTADFQASAKSLEALARRAMTVLNNTRLKLASDHLTGMRRRQSLDAKLTGGYVGFDDDFDDETTPLLSWHEPVPPPGPHSDELWQVNLQQARNRAFDDSEL